MKRVLLIALVALLGAAGCGGGSGSSGGGDSTTVRVVHAPSTLFAPLYIAQAKGYFKRQGIKVELETVKAGQDAIPLAASGKVDAVVAGFSAGLFNAINTGLDVKVVGSMGASTGDAEDSPTALEVSKKLVSSGTVTKVADLRGRKIAVSGGPGSAGGYQLDVILRAGGLRLGDVQTVNLGFPDMEAAISNGSVAAALTPAPFTTKMEENGVATALGVPPKGTVATGVVYGGEFAKTASAQKFFTALVQASADLQGDKAKDDENLKILAEATGQTIDVLKKVPFYTWRPDLAPDLAQLNAQQQAYLDDGTADSKGLIPANKYVLDTFAKKATP